jgi:hypothetical protein
MDVDRIRRRRKRISHDDRARSARARAAGVDEDTHFVGGRECDAKRIFIEVESRSEEFDFRFVRSRENLLLEIYQYPTDERHTAERELVFSHNGTVADVVTSFAETFEQLYEDRETDEFEFNWRQPFPFKEFEGFKSAVNL